MFYEGILIDISSLVSSSHFFRGCFTSLLKLVLLDPNPKEVPKGAAACTLAIMRLFTTYHDSILPQIVKTIVIRIVPWRKTRGISLSLSLIVFPFFPRKYCKKSIAKCTPLGIRSFQSGDPSILSPSLTFDFVSLSPSGNYLVFSLSNLFHFQFHLIILIQSFIFPHFGKLDYHSN